ncbi:hypothetical protein ACTMTI_39495 [Nonomuraea sp. H19]|uniref:hypothetical protein n=1 Tax=Nonomuraea sp. H19 TaxID=3452206 RepID=UPI003F8AC216
MEKPHHGTVSPSAGVVGDHFTYAKRTFVDPRERDQMILLGSAPSRPVVNEAVTRYMRAAFALVNACSVARWVCKLR